jgi:hypothetical protein
MPRAFNSPQPDTPRGVARITTEMDSIINSIQNPQTAGSGAFPPGQSDIAIASGDDSSQVAGRIPPTVAPGGGQPEGEFGLNQMRIGDNSSLSPNVTGGAVVERLLPQPSSALEPSPPEMRPSSDATTEFFEGFADGFTDSITLGQFKSDFGGEGTAGTIGEVVGFIAGEMPFYLIGLGVTKHVLRTTAFGIKAAARAKTLAQSTRYGKRVQAKLITTGAPLESGIGVGIEAGRVIGGDEEAFTPGRVALAGLTPFLPALYARPKTLAKATTKFGAFTPAERAFQRGQDVEAAFVRNPALDSDEMLALRAGAWDELSIPDDDLAEILGYENLYTTKFMHLGERKALEKLWAQGASTSEVLGLIGNELDDIVDAAARMDRSAWQARAIERTDVSINEFSSMLDSYDGSIVVIDDVPTNLATYQGLDPTLIREYDMDAIRSMPSGASGVESAADIMEHHKIVDRYRSVTQTGIPDPPRGKRLENRMWVAVQNNAPFTRRYLASLLKGLESLGPAGKETARLLDKTRLWSTRNGANASASINNTLDSLSPEQSYMFSRVASGQLGDNPVVDDAVDRALRTWNVHREVIENYYKNMGSSLRHMTSEGDLLTTGLTGPKSKHYLPVHVNDPDTVLNSPDVLEALTEEIVKRHDVPRNMGGAINAQGMQEVFLRKLHRQIGGDPDLGGTIFAIDNYKGSPKNFPSVEGLKGRALSKGLKAQQRWQEELRETLTMYVDNHYEAISRQRHMGTPNDFNNFDDIMTQEVIHSAPMQQALLNKFEGSQDIVDFKLARAFGGDVGTQEELRGIARNLEHLRGFDDAPVSMIGWGARIKALVKQIEFEGGDARAAEDAIDTFLGYKTYSSQRKTFSRVLRGVQTVTKLGLSVIDNLSQTAFTATRFGFKATYKALSDDIFNRKMSRDFAESAGALNSDIMRTIEIESGKSWEGEFLRRTGFATIERMNKAVGANAGKHFMMNNFALISRNPTSRRSKTAIRLMEKMGFQMRNLVTKDGEITALGRETFDAMSTKYESTVAKVLKDIAGFEGARGTQFLGDALDTPVGLQTPEGKIVGQFKVFVMNSARAFHRDIFDELRQGNPMPAVRMLVLGATIGEITQNARMVASGRDPRTRGQVGIIRELVGKTNLLDKDDEQIATILGQAISKSDIASRVIENVAAVGFGGLFVSMAQSALASGKLGLFGLVVGPTVDEAISIVGSTVQGAQTGNFEPLARRAIRTGGALVGSVPGVRAVPLVAFGATAVGRQAQLAIAPSEAQLETSLFKTEEESANIAVKSVVRHYNDARAEAREMAASGDRQASIARMREWNAGLQPRIRMLRNFGALNMQSYNRISFSFEDMLRTLEGGAEDQAEPGALATAGARSQQAGATAGRAFERIGEAFQ